MIVHKFGGTSVGDPACFANVADIVVEHYSQASEAALGGTVVVVSAMSGVTNQLIAGARLAAEGKDRLYRQIRAGLLSRHLDVVETFISVVGVPARNENSVVSHTFAALGKLGTEVIAVAQAATEHSMSFCIPEEQVVDTVRLLHRELRLEE
jgi:aspartokinase